MDRTAPRQIRGERVEQNRGRSNPNEAFGLPALEIFSPYRPIRSKRAARELSSPPPTKCLYLQHRQGKQEGLPPKMVAKIRLVLLVRVLSD